MRSIFLLLLLAVPFFTCQHAVEEPLIETPPPAEPPAPPSAEKIDILALGDSYTKGESVPWAKNFPNQLSDSLKSATYSVTGVHAIAQTGWRTDQLKSAIASQSGLIGDSIFSLVTLCIGVNNQYQGGTADNYKPDFELLLQTAIERAGGRKDRVVVLSIPDWAYTTYGQNFSGNPGEISHEIDQFNVVNKLVANSYGVHYIDVTGISRMGLSQPDLVAIDGLHPSALQYSKWIHLMMPVVRKALKN